MILHDAFEKTVGNNTISPVFHIYARLEIRHDVFLPVALQFLP